jgi:hypothetical protein
VRPSTESGARDRHDGDLEALAVEVRQGLQGLERVRHLDEVRRAGRVGREAAVRDDPARGAGRQRGVLQQVVGVHALADERPKGVALLEGARVRADGVDPRVRVAADEPAARGAGELPPSQIELHRFRPRRAARAASRSSNGTVRSRRI